MGAQGFYLAGGFPGKMIGEQNAHINCLLWIKHISEAIQKAGKVLVFLSPDYDNSPVCWDEFQCAKLMEYNRRQPVIQTIYLYKYNGEMPPIMGIYSYIDCREGDMDKLLASIPKLVG